jgi:hypothetical protein
MSRTESWAEGETWNGQPRSGQLHEQLGVPDLRGEAGKGNGLTTAPLP